MSPNSVDALALSLPKLIHQRWKTILTSLVLAVVVAVAYWLLAGEEFASVAKIMVMQKDPMMTSTSTDQVGDVQRAVREDLLATHMELLRSRKVIEKAIEEYDLADLPGVQEQLDEETTVLEYIESRLACDRGGDGASRDAQVISVRFRHKVPAETSQVLSAIIASYQGFLEETFKSVTNEAVTLIDKARQELGRDLELEQAAYAEFREEAPVLFVEGKALSPQGQQLVAIEQRRADLRLRKAMIESRLNLMQESLTGPNAGQFTDRDRLGLIDDEHIQRLNLLVFVERGDTVSEAFQAEQPERSEAASVEYQRLLTLRGEVESLEGRLGRRHPRVKEANQSIMQLVSFLDERGPEREFATDRLEAGEIIQSYVRLLESDLVHIGRQLENVAEEAEALMAQAKGWEQAQLEDVMRSDSIRRKEEIYDAVVQRLREVNLVTDYGGYITEVIAPVSEAETVWPQLPLLLALGLIVGATGGTGIAVFQELTDRTFYDPDHASQELGLSLLGTIGQMVPDVTDEEVETRHATDKLVVVHRPKSQDAEAVRGVRTSLFFAFHGGANRVLQVTSATPNDGKSLITSNLAASLASAGRSVLVIDADLRKPSQHANFDHAPQPGLSDVLIDEAELPDVIQETAVDGVSLLAAGTIPPNPAELLLLPRFGELLESMRGKFDYVLVDSPPVLAVSDPLNIAPQVDGVLVVVPLLKNHAGAAIRARQMLNEVAKEIVGVVVNDREGVSERGASGWYGYDSYSQRYGYGYGESSGYTSDAPPEVAR